jgi:hypothetical protein
MIVKLALIEIKKLPKQDVPQEQVLEEADKVVHVSRPNSGKLQQPIRLIGNK